eukprot:scaffold9905_cov117-Isochrysis_galbana.AAC.19
MANGTRKTLHKCSAVDATMSSSQWPADVHHFHIKTAHGEPFALQPHLERAAMVEQALSCRLKRGALAHVGLHPCLVEYRVRRVPLQGQISVGLGAVDGDGYAQHVEGLTRERDIIAEARVPARLHKRVYGGDNLALVLHCPQSRRVRA